MGGELMLPMIKMERIKDTQEVCQITPDITISNIHSSQELIQSLHQIGNGIKKRLLKTDMGYKLYKKDTLSYEIYLSQEQIKFTLIFPTRYTSYVDNKIKDSWKGVGINTTDDYIQVFENEETLSCEMKLENHYFMTLLTDKRKTSTLDSILNTVGNLVDDDKLLFQLLLQPVGNSWHFIADNKYEQFKEGKLETSNKNLVSRAYVFLYENIISEIVEFINEVIATFIGVELKNNQEIRKTRPSIRREMEIDKTKTMYDGFNFSLRLFSYSKDDARRSGNLDSLIVAMRSFDADNMLQPGKIKRGIKIKRELGKYSVLFPQILNTNEVQKMIVLPNASMQKEYKQLKTISNKQTNLPDLAFDNKGILIGKYNLKGEEVDIHFSNIVNDIAQSKALICSQGGGKTTYMQNYIYEAYQKNQCVVVIDHVQGCELTNEIIPYISEDRLEVINLKELTERDEIKGLGYNEVYRLLSSDNPRDRVNGANRIATQLTELLNSVTLGATEPLSSQMIKYLSSACRVVYSVNKESSIMDVYYCLEDAYMRESYISKALTGGFYKADHIDIRNLSYLTKEEKGEMVTRIADIKGILNRFSGIQALDLNILELFSNKVDDSIDFNKYIDENKVVFIQIPQTEFENDVVRDILTTFFCTKLWLTCQTRPKESLKLTHLILDEVSMIPSTNMFLSKYITQFRRHLLSTLFACHNLNQFRAALSNINSSGLNLIIMSGVKHEAVKTIEEDLTVFDWNDIKNLKSRCAVVSTTYNNEKVEFVVRLLDKFYKRKRE